MTSLARGASSASKPRPVNVNSLYSGRNLAAGAKPLGKYGLTSVGKSVGVVRRMPPPATLPSLKSENNGQDPTTVVVPQGGVGWNKSEAPADSADISKSQSSLGSTGPDLRPTWAKQPQDSVHNGDNGKGEFPTLSTSTHGTCASQKGPKKWAVENLHSESRGPTIILSDDVRMLPSRYYDNRSESTGVPPRSSSLSQRPRFQGSSDARLSQPNYHMPPMNERGSKFTDSEKVDESKQSTPRNGTNPVAVKGSGITSASCQMNERSDLFFDGVIREETRLDADESRKVEFDRDHLIDRSRYKRTNFRSMEGDEASRQTQVDTDSTKPAHGVRTAANPGGAPKERTESYASDEEDDVQMTKLDKPAVRVVKRVPEANEMGTDEEQSCMSMDPMQSAEVEKRSSFREPVAERSTFCEQSGRSADGRDSPEHMTEPCQPAPAPAENIWAKRQEERESQEKERRTRMPKVMQDAIEQHFPSVSEAASIKVDKDAARRSSNSDFARATMRARRQQDSSDVRQLMASDRMMQRDQRLESFGETRRYDFVRVEPRMERERIDYGGDDAHGQRWRGNVSPRRAMIYSSNANDQAINRSSGERLYRNDGSGARRAMTTRTRGIRSQGRGGTNVQPQILRRSSETPKSVDNESLQTEDRSSVPAPSTKDDPTKPSERPTLEPTGEISPAAERLHGEDVVKGNSSGTSRKHVNGNRVGVQVQDESENGNVGGRYRVSPQHDVSSNRRHTNRWHCRVSCPRGHPRRGRGGIHHPRPEFPDGHAQRLTKVNEDCGRDGENAGSVKHVKGRNSYQQQRNRRKFDIGQNLRGFPKPLGQDRTERLRSPVVSSEGYDEWETASESSTRAAKEDRTETTAGGSRRVHAQNRVATAPPSSNSLNVHKGGTRFSSQCGPHSESSVTNTSSPNERSRGSKNAQPASRTCQSPSGSCSKSNKQSNGRMREIRSVEKNISDGLAGLDLNNIASVVVIDDHLVDATSVDTNEEFEEVLNKRAKKQKAHEMQAKMEAEERKKAREKERQARAQARKLSRQRNIKKEKKDETQKDSKRANESGSKLLEQKKTREHHKKNAQQVSQSEETARAEKSSDLAQEAQADVRKDVPVTTVWNSAHVAEQKELLEGAQPVIPSPIARPTPRSKSAASDSPPTFQDLVRRQIVELPVSLSSSQPIRADKYDFTFDPRLHEEQVSNEKVLTSLSTGASSEAGSTTEDFRLKEKLYKVKGLWSGEEKDSEALPSNVAKVKPQPQSGAEHVQNDSKPAVSFSSNSYNHNVPPKSPGIAPFPSGLGGLMFSPYPVMFGDMSVGRAYTSIGSMVQPLIPPSNASSPPVCPSLYQQPPSLSNNHPTMNQRQVPMRSNFFDQNAVIASNMPPSQNMAWNSGNVDVVSNGTVSSTPSQQHPAHISSSVQSSQHMALHRATHPPPPPPLPQNHSQAAARGYGVNMSGVPPNGAYITPPPPSAGAGGGPLVPPLPIPPPELINMPPPIGSQRVTPFTIQYTGFAPPPLAHAVHPSHNFNQPPPNVRFAQPPPPIQQDQQWEKAVAVPSAGVRQHFTMFTGQTPLQANAIRPNQQTNKWGVSGNPNVPPPQMRSMKMQQSCVGVVTCASGTVMEHKSSCNAQSLKPSIGKSSQGS